MSTATQTITGRLLRTSGPAAEPVTVAEAKKQLEIPTSLTAHDDQLTMLIVAAREQFEHDTQYVCVTQAFEYVLDEFPADLSSVVLPVFPISSLTSVTYMDGSTQQTLATSVASLDRRKRQLSLKYDQRWPTIEKQTDAVVIAFQAGYASQAAVPRLIKQAILLQVAKNFEERDMMSPHTEETFDLAYERIIRRLMRSSYP